MRTLSRMLLKPPNFVVVSGTMGSNQFGEAQSHQWNLPLVNPKVGNWLEEFKAENRIDISDICVFPATKPRICMHLE